jgi:hypothetical protein
MTLLSGLIDLPERFEAIGESATDGRFECGILSVHSYSGQNLQDRATMGRGLGVLPFRKID